MTTITGGGSSAVGASTLSACERFRGTDPLVTGVPRRALAADLGFPDTAAGIPEARWMRAMTFERLVRDEAFAAQVTTTTVGGLGLDRPDEVAVVDAHCSQAETIRLLEEARDRARSGGADGGPVATLIYQPEVPFPGVTAPDATPIKPDFLIVTARTDDDGAWVVMGDAKDYERVRSRIDDGRLLKGYLQVALGAEALDRWTLRPDGLEVHRFGVLAVPRNAYLQPTAVLEDLRDHRTEVRWFLDQRLTAAANPTLVPTEHLVATFDPASCATCSLFAYCRNELRTSDDDASLRIELGLAPEDDGPTASAVLRATREGVAQLTGQGRVDAVGLPGTVNVVVAKSDAATLGLHGIALQRMTPGGPTPWEIRVFDDPQSDATRRTVMELLGAALDAASAEAEGAVHVVVPDQQTADVLATVADALAGVELSRLRWERDLEQGREALTFDGEPARIPQPLGAVARVAVSFFLEDDRARALTLRSPVVDLRAVLARHVVAGGPAVDSLRLDYLATWATATEPLDHRAVADHVEALVSTPGARLTNVRSDEIHHALSGTRGRSGRPADPERYAALVIDELAYKQGVVDDVVAYLGTLPTSRAREMYEGIESSAQAVWRRRVELHSSDLVRFGRTAPFWRNALVPIIEADSSCREQLTAVSHPQRADEMAADPSHKYLTRATVTSLDPLLVDVESRRFGRASGDEAVRAVLLHTNGTPAIENAVSIKHQGGSFKIDGFSIGPLHPHDDGTRPVEVGAPSRMVWEPEVPPALSVGDAVVLADFGWFAKTKGNRYFSVPRPPVDKTLAPKDDCQPGSFADDPESHGFCCRPHEIGEAEYSDVLAERRENDELNPQAWPPVRDLDAFEVPPDGLPRGDATTSPPETPPADLTINDLE
ncbi:hypothetical protein [Paraoerskovia marina]|uniref:hypothetical protein n=1 Tax=Paraoerskovia marina TaxID=545619 RepID=UPI0004929451|nr:hypothetical protein [Paraoerskovia marina]